MRNAHGGTKFTPQSGFVFFLREDVGEGNKVPVSAKKESCIGCSHW